MQDQPTLHAPKQGQQTEPLRVKNIAAALRLPASTVYAEVRSGRLPSYRVGTGRGTIRVSRTAFQTYLDERGIPAEELGVAL